MEHNDATDKDLPADPDATELVPVDSEALLHAELDAERAFLAQKASAEKASKRRVPAIRPAAGRPPSIATVRAMRAAPRASTNMAAASSSRFPASKSAIPRPPIHTLLPPRQIDPYRDLDEEDSDAAATRVFDRNSAKVSVRTSVPSVKSVAFPAPAFSAPEAPQPFHTIPAIPAAKRSSVPPADDSARTRNQPVLAPTSRRDIRVSAFESLAPMAMSAFPSAPPPANTTKLTGGSLLAIALTMFFTIASVAVMAIGMFKPTAIDRAKIAVGTAMKGKPKPVSAASAPESAVTALPVAPRSVPPVLVDEMPADLGEKETALFLPDSVKGHRVFVDGKVINENDTDKRVVVATCGKHKVQLGSSGKEQVLDLPCHGMAHPE